MRDVSMTDARVCRRRHIPLDVIDHAVWLCLLFLPFPSLRHDGS